jgi:hypothetical protein
VEATDRVEDAKFLWREGRRGSGLLLVCVGVAARARREYPGTGDGNAFARLVADHLSASISVEFRGTLWPIERLLYTWVRCELVHTGAVPLDIEIDDGLRHEGLSVRAGGDPERVLKLSPSWFDLLVSVAEI